MTKADALRDNALMSDAEMNHRIEMRLASIGMSANAASEAAGQDRNFIRDILRGKSREPSAGRMASLAKVLQCRLEWLLTGEGPETDDQSTITPRQRAFLAQLERLPPDEQDRLFRLARALEQSDDGDSCELRRG